MEDIDYLKRCLQIAELGSQYAAPNPLVGAVLVYNDRIIGEGYHKKYGEGHAEVNCVNSVNESDRQFIKDSVMYVNLEPCSHYGKTPPCADLLIKNKIKRVIISSTDPAPHVSGKGIEKMEKAGITVNTGLLDEENKWLNRRFFSHFVKNRPYIILKWAQSKDGYFAPVDGSQKWISNSYFKKIVHQWRSREQAILVGKNTAMADNPQLNNRLWTGRSPIRILIDKNLEIKKDRHLYDQKQKTIVFNGIRSETDKNVTLIDLNFEKNIIPQILDHLYQINIQSLIVEGGIYTLNSFINSGLWDEARVITGNEKWDKGLKAPSLSEFPMIKNIDLMDNKLLIYQNDRQGS